MTRTAAFMALATLIASCSPGAAKKGPGEPPKPAARNCPDPDLRDKNDPCSPMYLHRQKPRFKRDSL